MNSLCLGSELYKCEAAVMQGCGLYFLQHAGVLGPCPCADEGSPVSLSCPHQLEGRSCPAKRLKGCSKTRDYFLGIILTDFHL